MKTIHKSIVRIFLVGGIVSSLFSSCTDNYMDYNRNWSEVTKEEMERDGYLLSAAMLGMQNNVIPVEEHLNQFTECLLGGVWGGYFADSQTWSNSFSYLNQSQDWLGKLYLDMMPNVYSNWLELKNVTDDPVILSVGQVIKVAALSRVVDSYGPIPYSQVGVDGKLTAPFDSQKDIYYKMFEELNASITTLTENQTNDFTASADDVYGGKVEKWIKFANSLKLRLAMRLVYADKNKAEAMAKEAIDTSDGKLGVMTSNDDNAFMKVNIVGKNVTVTPAIAEKITKKLNVLTKYFIIDEQDTANVLIRTYPLKQKIEVTIPTKYAILRAEVVDDDLYAAIDLVIDKLEDQIRRQKTRIQKKNKTSLAKAFVEQEAYEAEEDIEEVVKTKSIVCKEMSLDEAIMKMELLNHDFFIYTDDETQKIAVVYKRNDGGYGLIETE